MTMIPLDIPRIEAALDALTRCTPDARLLALKNLCENNGTWTVPERPGTYSPVLYEISLFGVTAIADDIERLPHNWRLAARNILNGLGRTA